MRVKTYKKSTAFWKHGKHKPFHVQYYMHQDKPKRQLEKLDMSKGSWSSRYR